MYVRQTPKGTWRFAECYKDPLTGKRREVSVTLAKNTAAARKEAAICLQKKISAMSVPDSHSIRLGDLIDKFVTYQYSMHKASTAKQDEMHLRTVEKLIGSDALVSKITPEVVTAALRQSGKDNTWANQKIRHIKLLWRWAYRHGYADNTALIDRLERLPEPSSRQKVIGKYMESDELKLVLTDMSESNADYMLLTKFLALSGLRIGEAIALTTQDIDLKSREIAVNKTYALNVDAIQSTKTEMSDRSVYMRRELLDLVQLILKRQRQIQIATGIRTRILFPWSDGGYMHYASYSKFFRYHTRKVLGHGMTIHSLRHTYTSLMAEAGVPIETISRQLGHADSKVTRDIYMHVTERIKQADNERLEAVCIL